MELYNTFFVHLSRMKYIFSALFGVIVLPHISRMYNAHTLGPLLVLTRQPSFHTFSQSQNKTQLLSSCCGGDETSHVIAVSFDAELFCLFIGGLNFISQMSHFLFTFFTWVCYIALKNIFFHFQSSNSCFSLIVNIFWKTPNGSKSLNWIYLPKILF